MKRTRKKAVRKKRKDANVCRERMTMGEKMEVWRTKEKRQEEREEEEERRGVMERMSDWAEEARKEDEAEGVFLLLLKQGESEREKK